MVDQLWAKAPANLIRDASLTLTDLRVYLEIDIRAGRRGWWWGTQHELGDSLGVSARSVRTAVAQLRDRGYISTRRTENRAGAITYTVHARSGSTLPIFEPEGVDRIGSRLPIPGDRLGSLLPIRRKRTSSGSQKITSEKKIPRRRSSHSSLTDWETVMQAHREKLDEDAG